MNRSNVLFCSILTLHAIFAWGQHRDSVNTSNSIINIVPATSLILTGIIINDETTKISIQEKVHDILGTSNSPIEDYIQYAPTAGFIAYQLSRSLPDEKKYHLRQYLISSVSNQVITYGLKHLTSIKRPTGGPYSFPSGHTSFAFSTATVLFQIYKDEHPLLAWLSYVPAIFTGTMRVVGDHHWVPDVLAGAGIGILSTQLTYKLLPNRKIDKSSSAKWSQNLHFGISPHAIMLVYTIE